MKKILKKILALTLVLTFSFGTFTIQAAEEKESSTETSSSTMDNEKDTNTEDKEENKEEAPKAEWPNAPELYSEIALLMDADTGAILYEKNIYERTYPASTTKLLTGLLTVENCNLSEIVYTSYAAATSVAIDDSNIGSKVGEEYTVEQALYALLVHSANEVAYALAEHVGGDLPSFVMMMNMRAEELGVLNTHFNNASGLHSEYHYTTAYDLAMIGRACLNNATFVSFDSYAGYYFMEPTNKTSVKRTLMPRNEMLKGGKHYYEYCKGGKTGFTDEAGYTLVTFAEKNGVRLIAVTLRSGKNERFTDCIALFNYGFANFTKHTPDEATISTLFGENNYFHSHVFGSSLPAFRISSTTLQLPSGVSSSSVKIKADDKVQAKNEKGNFSSKINFVYNDGINDHTVGTANLTLTSNTIDSDLPYIAEQKSETTTKIVKPTINIWIIIGIIIALDLIYCAHNWILNSLDLGRRKRRWK